MSTGFRDNGGQAFPSAEHQKDYDGNTYTSFHDGMTLRDYFAAKAMMGWLASYGPDAVHPIDSPQPKVALDHLAKGAYAIADSMIAERNK